MKNQIQEIEQKDIDDLEAIKKQIEDLKTAKQNLQKQYEHEFSEEATKLKSVEFVASAVSGIITSPLALFGSKLHQRAFNNAGKIIDEKQDRTRQYNEAFSSYDAQIKKLKDSSLWQSWKVTLKSNEEARKLKTEIEHIETKIDNEKVKLTILKDEKDDYNQGLVQIKITELSQKSKLTRKERKFLNKHQPNYKFTGKWKKFIGNPTQPFHILIYGSAGQGKSHFCVQLTKYLTDNFGLLLYVAAEEGNSSTFDNKLDRYEVTEDETKIIILNTDDVNMIEREIEESKPKFVVFDSLTTCGITDKKLKVFKNKFSDLSTISITQSTQQGKAKGGTEYEHNCQMIIRVVKGKAIQDKNRFSDWEVDEYNIFS